MDTFDEYREEMPAQEELRHTSPFADSPYECVFAQPVEKPKKLKKERYPGIGKKLLTVVCVAAAFAAGCGLTGAVVSSTYRSRLEQLSLSSQQKMAQMEHRIEALEKDAASAIAAEGTETAGLTPGLVYTQNADAVVRVIAYGEAMSNGGMEGVGSSGSGFIFSQDGYVATNYHVVQDMTEYYVVLQDKTELPAELVGYEASVDVAVLKVEGENLPTVQLGSSDSARVGDRVVAIGYPLESDTASLTVGYVSAKDQVISTDGSVSNMLQTDAAINSGNSGGPLFNENGEVIGITTAKFSGYSSTGVSIEGMGFAIPMDEVLGILRDLQQYGYITGAYLGVYVRDVDAYVQMYGLPAGAYVESTMEGLAAERGGIRTGDVIVRLEGYDIESVAGLTSALRRFQAGDTVAVTVWRNGREVHLSVTLDERPVEQTQTVTEQPQTQDAYEEEWEEFFDSFFDNFPENDG